MTKLHMTNLARMDEHIDADRLQQLQRQYRSGRLMRYFIRPLLIAIMLTALVVGLLAVVVEVSEDTRWYGLSILLFFVALETIYTTNWLNHPRQLPLDRSSYRAAELLLLIVIVRLATWLIFEEGIPDTADLIDYLHTPQILFLNGRFLIAVVLAAIIWRLAILVSHIFYQLQISEFELRFHSLPLAQRKARVEDQPIQPGRSGLVESFLRFWLLGGLLLVAAVGFSTLEEHSVDTFMAPLASGRVNLEPRLLGALLLYFIIGLWLLSQARLMQIHARWLLNNVQTDEKTWEKWQRTSLLVLILVVLVAAFLPIGSTSALSQIVNVLLFWILAIANFLIFLLVLPIAMLLALLSGQAGEEPIPPPALEPLLLQQLPLENGNSYLRETISMVLSSGFWAVLIVLIAMALLFYLRERRQTSMGQIKTLRLSDRILLWLRGIWARLRGQVHSLQDALILLREVDSEVEQPQAKKPRWRFLRVSSLSPRDQLRYFYLSTVRRAGERGVKREPADTPSEYTQDLKQYWPEAEEGLDDLTQAFLKARYSDEEISAEDIPSVKGVWKELRRELNQKPDAKEEKEEEKGEEP
jgi:hypothetical protein